MAAGARRQSAHRGQGLSSAAPSIAPLFRPGPLVPRIRQNNAAGRKRHEPNADDDRCGVLAAGMAAPRGAQDYPTQTIKMISSFGAGGGSDIVGRIIAPRMQEKLGQTVVVENRPGAGGLLGNEAVANSPKDGYTLGVQTAGQIITPVMTKNVRFDAVESFDWIGQIAIAGLLIVVRPDYPYKDIKSLVAAAKAEPGKIVFAQPGLRRDAASRRRVVQAGRRRRHAARALPHLARSAREPAQQEHRRAVRHHDGAARPGRSPARSGRWRSPARTASRRRRTSRPRSSPAWCRTTTSPPGTACTDRRACRRR